MTRNVSQVQKNLGDLLDRVSTGGERIILRRRGQDVAVLVPVADLKLLKKIEDRLDNAAADKALKDPARIPWEKLKKELNLR
jgi:prevent-host-death family protein